MFGIGDVTGERIIKFFGPPNVLPTIKKDPYQLMRVPGISFRRADNIGLNIGIKKDDPRPTPGARDAHPGGSNPTRTCLSPGERVGEASEERED